MNVPANILIYLRWAAGYLHFDAESARQRRPVLSTQRKAGTSAHGQEAPGTTESALMDCPSNDRVREARQVIGRPLSWFSLPPFKPSSFIMVQKWSRFAMSQVDDDDVIVLWSRASSTCHFQPMSEALFNRFLPSIASRRLVYNVI
jgi:hypothetical protein